MEEEEKDRHEYRLSIQFDPWQAVLEPLQTSASIQVNSSEKFRSPLELLERLERPPQPHRGVK